MDFLKRSILNHRADAIMSGIVFIWGFNFVIMKDGISDIAPLTYNALRFTIALPLLTAITLQDRAVLRLSRRDFGLVLITTLVGPVAYQLLFISGLARTTSTNTALLVATSPAWTAILSILVGMVDVRRRLVTGLAVTFGGVVLVVLNRAGADVSLSHDDLSGSLLAVAAAFALALGNVVKKPLVDRLGGMRMSFWSYWMMTISLLLIAAPDLLTLSPDDVPVSRWPHVAYSGMLAGVGGFTAVNYALKELGPTRTATYYNYTPIVAGLAGVLILGDSLSVGLVTGGALTLWGVMVVRNNIYKRKANKRSR